MSPAQVQTIDRAAINRANSQHSTGPRTARRQTAVLRSTPSATASPPHSRPAVRRTPPPTKHHCRDFFDEYQPATPTETQLVQELADTAWRLNRIPILEAELLDRAAAPATARAGNPFRQPRRPPHPRHPRPPRRPPLPPVPKDAHQLRELQAERRQREDRDLAPPPHSSNSINTKAFPTTPPRWLRFFKRPNRRATPSACPPERVPPYRTRAFPHAPAHPYRRITVLTAGHIATFLLRPPPDLRHSSNVDTKIM